jgi:hypothetical protein
MRDLTGGIDRQDDGAQQEEAEKGGSRQIEALRNTQ